MKLSIIIPVFNEEKTVGLLLEKVLAVKIPQVIKEIIIVDDKSTDNTVIEIKKIQGGRKLFKLLKHTKNQGKGRAVRTGFSKATGDYIIIQDADLEYDPKQIIKLIQPIISKKAEVVYGTRLDRLPNFYRDESKPLFVLTYLGNRFLSLIASLLYGKWITDMETGYKLLPQSAAQKMKLSAKGFEIEPEITAKILKMGYRIMEVPISTNPRGFIDGKKLNPFKEGPKALWTLVKYRFVD